MVQHQQMRAWMFWTVLIFHTASCLVECMIGGSDAAGEDFPWAVYIRAIDPAKEKIHHCGATIISDRWMISAAHCFYKPSGVHAQDDVNHYNGTAFILNLRGSHLKQFTVERHYWVFLSDGSDNQHDIALIKLSADVPPYRSRSPIVGLPESLNNAAWPPINTVSILVGWKSFMDGESAYSKAQFVQLQTLEEQLCRGTYKEAIDYDPDHEFCAGVRNSGQGISPGDSGSGLIYVYEGKPVLVGIAVRYFYEKPENYPTLFTRVSSFKYWISRTMQQIQ